MSNFYTEIINDLDGVQEKILGSSSNYSYYKEMQFPEAINDLLEMNPLAIFSNFLSGTNPDSMQKFPESDTIIETKTEIETISDIKNLSPGWFQNYKNSTSNLEITKVIEESSSPFDDLEDFLIYNDSNIFKMSDIVAYLYFSALIMLIISSK